MNMNLNKKKGISLIVLVITIVVMIILASAVILSLNETDLFSKANKSKRVSDIVALREKIGVGIYNYLIEHHGEFDKDDFLDNIDDYVSNAIKNGDIIELNGQDFNITEDGVVTEILEKGIYVEYNVKYFDMYEKDSNGNYVEYTKTTGWKYLGIDEETGNQAIISTGTPLELNYSSAVPSSWWGSAADCVEYFGGVETDYATAANPYIKPGYMAAAGLRQHDNMKKIQFTYQANGSITNNYGGGIYRGVNGKTTNILDIEEFTLPADGAKLRIPTYEEMMALDIQNVTKQRALRRAIGQYHWLSTPHPTLSGSESLWCLQGDGLGLNAYGSYPRGLRLVVVLPTGYILTEVK